MWMRWDRSARVCERVCPQNGATFANEAVTLKDCLSVKIWFFRLQLELGFGWGQGVKLGWLGCGAGIQNVY